MRDRIDKLLTAYDEERISRRQLIGALLMVSATGPLAVDAGQQKPAVNLTGTPPPGNALFRGRIVNHVTLRVKNVDDSRRFESRGSQKRDVEGSRRDQRPVGQREVPALSCSLRHQ